MRCGGGAQLYQFQVGGPPEFENICVYTALGQRAAKGSQTLRKKQNQRRKKKGEKASISKQTLTIEHSPSGKLPFMFLLQNHM